MEHTEEKSNAYKEGWNANCKGQSRLVGGQEYDSSTTEYKDWLKGFDEAQKEWNSGKTEPRIITINYTNPLQEGWEKLSYH